MSSYNFYTRIALKENEDDPNNVKDEYLEMEVPRFIYGASGEICSQQINFSYEDKSIYMKSCNKIVKFIMSNYTEILADMNDGTKVWFDGREAPHSSCLDGKYTGDTRESTEFSIAVHNQDTGEIVEYNCIPKGKSDISEQKNERFG